MYCEQFDGGVYVCESPMALPGEPSRIGAKSTVEIQATECIHATARSRGGANRRGKGEACHDRLIGAIFY
jgi:hypothetical protein